VSARLLVSCPDGPGIVAAVSRFLFEREANITSSDQYSTHPTGGRFLMRMAFELPGAEERRAELEEAFGREVGARFAMEWRVTWDADPRRIAILVSRGELGGEITQVVSNHPDARRDVEVVGVPFHHVPVERARKAEAEAAQLGLLAGRIDLLVLARYMQVLSGDFLARVGCPVINIHHSFLPAFAGAAPYERARERGVKIIGATAHYATEELDAGPIIEQDVIRVDHRDTVADLARIGRDIERVVLARAVTRHLDDRVLVDGPRTVVF